ncbi:ABC transporter substrate-binding protein [Paenibacillus sp. 2TAB23]|uniref:extracellular solute-binding protein n=1 Tax=Paenibacillus sp. 2TAB23 TaxID=3233004 RepID=UPI003F9C833A
MRKKWTIGIAAGLALTLAACSSGNNNPQQSPAAEKSNTSATAEATTKKVTITTLEGTWSSIPGPDGDGLKRLNEKFNVDYKPQFVPYDQLTSKLPVAMASGDLADVIGMESVDANFVKWAKQGAFLRLNDYIDNYPMLKAIPKSVWDAVTVDGQIYALPHYFPAKYGKKAVIRQDWLDQLGLAMPTNYEELKKVAVAFTKDDPDQNGINDTYGFGLSKQIVYGAAMGAAWDTGWYHKNDQGQYIPGMISESFKEQTQFLADLYKEGALHKDWAVTKNTDVRTDFYAGKYGIWYEQPTGIDQNWFKTMKEQVPGAEIAVIPAFKQADGEQGFTALSGYYTITMLNAKLKDEPDKVDRYLQMQDYFRTFIPVDERNPQNPEYDWQWGGVDVGYKMVNGSVVVEPPPATEKRPTAYMKVVNWAPNDEANEPAKMLADPFAKSFADSTVELLKNTKFYINPVNRISSEVLMSKGSELDMLLQEWQTKMIVGQEQVSDWDKMVDEYMNKGGKEVIDDVNRLLNDGGIAGEWK